VRASGTEEAALVVARELAHAAARGGHIAISGGSSPRRAYELAAEAQPDWSRVEVWFADDRCVPPADERSNYRLAQETLLGRLAAAPAAVHRVQGELAPEAAAQAYDDELRGVVLDLAVLGIGPDGHTASLFPNAPALGETERRAVAVPAGFEPFVDRVTLTLPVLRAARLVLFLVDGAGKAEAAKRAFAAEPSPAVPASLVRSEQGRTLVVMDEAAAQGFDLET